MWSAPKLAALILFGIYGPLLLHAQGRLETLPENPCNLLSADELSAVTGLEVTSVQRTPGVGEIVRARRENREPDPGTLCIYETNSDFGAIHVHVRPPAERRASDYWAGRSKYFETFPDSAEPVESLGIDAWLAGKVSLTVLVHENENEYFTLRTQLYQPGSRELLIQIARHILSQLK